jgi:2-methylcitrate dehydratase PrpD
MEAGAPAITEEIARFAIEAEPGHGPAALTETASRAFVDTIGVTIAARHEEGFLALLRTTLEECRPGPSTVLTTGERTGPAAAALLNGMAGHALDYDDVTDPLSGHPSVALIPALLAVAEHRGASGQELLDAYVVGFEVACAVSAGLPIRPHYTKGWHSTATVGVLAATAGVCRLLEVGVDTTRHALGIAASMASGSQQNFGTMTKPLHPGLAGWSAVMAGRLAENGYTADQSQLEGRLGYFALYGIEPDLPAVHDRLERPWALLADGVNVKKYPCCYNTHRAADAALTLSAKLQGDVEGVDAVRLTLEPGGFQPLIRHRPVTGLEGKFSAEYVLAAGLIDGHLSLDTFTDAAVQRPEAQTLLRKVELSEAEVPPFGDRSWEQAYAAVEVGHHGQPLRERVDVPRGDARQPLTQAELEAKFRDCLAHAGVSWDADALLAELKGLPTRDRLDGFASLAEAPLLERPVAPARS